MICNGNELLSLRLTLKEAEEHRGVLRGGGRGRRPPPQVKAYCKRGKGVTRGEGTVVKGNI